MTDNPPDADGALDLGAVRERQHATTGPHAWIGSEAHWDAIIASLADVPDLVDEVVALRLTLTEAEAERDTLTARLADCHLGKEVLRSRLSEAEKVVEHYRSLSIAHSGPQPVAHEFLGGTITTRAETTDG